MSDFKDWWSAQGYLSMGYVEAEMAWDEQQEIIDQQAAEIERLEARLKVLQDAAFEVGMPGEYLISINTIERKAALYGEKVE